MSRTFTAGIVGSLLLLIGDRGWTSSIQLRSGDPPVDGKKYLLTDAEFRAALATARAFLWGTPIDRVTVVSPTKIRARYVAPITESVSWLALERSGNRWHVAEVEWGPSHRRPNQPMKPTAPDRIIASNFATDPARGLSLSR
jgi:hypothetical protein